MAIVTPNEAEGNILDKLFEDDLSFRLFKNDITPGDSTVLADFTVADFTGYANITLTGGAWTNTEANPSVAAYAQQTFTSSADQTAQTIYGWYLVHGTLGLFFAERFASSASISTNGQTLKITPEVDLQAI